MALVNPDGIVDDTLSSASIVLHLHNSQNFDGCSSDRDWLDAMQARAVASVMGPVSAPLRRGIARFGLPFNGVWFNMSDFGRYFRLEATTIDRSFESAVSRRFHITPAEPKSLAVHSKAGPHSFTETAGQKIFQSADLSFFAMDAYGFSADISNLSVTISIGGSRCVPRGRATRPFPQDADFFGPCTMPCSNLNVTTLRSKYNVIANYDGNYDSASVPLRALQFDTGSTATAVPTFAYSFPCIKHGGRDNIEYGKCCGLPGEISCANGYELRLPSADVCSGMCPAEWCAYLRSR